MPARELSGLEAALGQAFGQQPPIALQGGAAWVGAVQRRLGAVPLAPLPGSMAGDGLALARLGAAPEEHRAAHPRSHGLRALIWFWGVLLAGAGTGVAVLQSLGPPVRRENAAPQVRAVAEPAWLPVWEEERARDLLLAPPLRVPESLTEPPTVSSLAEASEQDGTGSVPVPAAEAGAARRQDLAAPPVASASDPSEAAPSQSAAAVAVRDQVVANPAVPNKSSAPDPIAPEPVLTKAPVSASALHDAALIVEAPLPVWVTAAVLPDAVLRAVEAGADMPNPPAEAPPTQVRGQSEWGQREPSPDTDASAIAAAPLRGAITATTATPPSVEAPPPVLPMAAEATEAKAAAVSPLVPTAAKSVEPRADAPSPVPPAETEASGSKVAAPAQLPATFPLQLAGTEALITEALIRRADDMIALKDISAARLLYRRAAAAGSGQATLALGKSYDPFFLADIGVRGIAGDAATATEWYRRALSLGVGEARERMALHGVRPEE
jgi:hypothetical protein